MKTNDDTSNGTRRRDSVHELWLLLVGISARDGLFEPTKKEQIDLDILILRLGLKPSAVERLTDQARRFCQIQNELAGLVNSEQEFKQAGIDLQAVMVERQAALRQWGQKLQLLERSRRLAGQQVVRQAALRAESENIQRAVSRGGSNE